MQLLENTPGGSFTPREMVPAQLRELQKERSSEEEPPLHRASAPKGANGAPGKSLLSRESVGLHKGVSALKGARGRSLRS